MVSEFEYIESYAAILFNADNALINKFPFTIHGLAATKFAPTVLAL